MKTFAHNTQTTRGPYCKLWRLPMRQAAILAWATIAIPCLWGQASQPTDYEVKAVYLYNFGRFVEWPEKVASKGEPFTVCVLGQDPFGPALDAALAGETIGGRSVVAKRVSTTQESVSCQILFVGSGDSGRLNRIVEALDKEAVLTVSDMPQFSQRGGMIQFVLEGKKVRFEVNLAAVQRVGLVPSSELLKVATAVIRKGPSGD